MPKGPKGEKRPADVIGNAVHVMRIATGQIDEQNPMPKELGKNPAAVALGRLGGLKGGKARAAKLTPKERQEMSRKAAQLRWAAKKTD
jgi:hypothetical protein